MKVLCFAGSLRSGSYNKKLARVANRLLLESGTVQAEFIDLLDYPLPVYNQDIESIKFPEPALALTEKIANVQAVVISSPENNGAIAAVLKNTMDWVSRSPQNQNPWPKKWILLLGASPGGLGAIRGLWHTRVPFEALGCYVYPEMFGLAKAHEAFDDQGALKDLASQDRLAKLIKAFISTASER